MRANNKKFLLSSAATATAGATASLSSSQSLSQSTDDSSTIIPNSTTIMMTTQTSELVRQKSTTMPNNPSLSSSSSASTQDESTSSNKTRLLQRMISLRRSSSSKPSTPILSTHMSTTSTASCRSYNVRAFEIARDRNLRHYPCIIHFLDDTERTFHIDVSVFFFSFLFHVSILRLLFILASMQRSRFTQRSFRISRFVSRTKVFWFIS